MLAKLLAAVHTGRMSESENVADPVNPYASPQSDVGENGGSAGENQQQYRLVYIGLSLVYWGVILILLGVLAMIGGLFLRNPLEVTTVGRIGALINILGLALVSIGALLVLIGPVFCLSVPRESGCRPFIIASIALQLLNPVLTTGLTLSGLALWTIVSGPTAAFLASAAFALFLRKLAEHLGQFALREQASRVLVASFLLLVTYVGGTMLRMGDIRGMLALAFGVAILLGTLIVFVMYVNLINNVRRAIR